MLYRRVNYPSVWNEMERFQREFNRLFDDAFSGYDRPAPDFPAMNIWTNDEAAVITAEVPGVDPDNLNISIINQNLTLTGERTLDKVGENAEYHRQERGYGKFSRSIELPFMVDANSVEARLEKGVLQIHLPRAEAEKPKKITVKTIN